MALKRRLGFWGVFCIATGAMISSGLFVLPGIVFAQAGPAVVLSYALAGVLVVPALLSKAELATAMPRSGGSYFFIERSMGALPGILAGSANWFAVALKSAFALVGIGAFARLIAPDVGETTIKAVAIGCCVLFTLLNLLSVKFVGRAQVLMVAVLFVILGVFIVVGIPATKHDHFAGFMDKGLARVIAMSGMVFVSFGGLTKAVAVAGEVHHPGRNLPRGMFAAALVVTLLYVAAIFTAVGVLEPQTLCGNLTPLSIAAERVMGRAGLIILSLGAMLAFVTTANAGILTASRGPMAMSHDGLLPGALQKVSRRFGTPYVAILLTGGFMVAVIAGLSITSLIKAASAMMLMLFVLVNLSVLVMRGSKIQNYRPLYVAPLYPWLQWAGIVAYVFLIVQMGTIPLTVTGLFAASAMLWYLIYVRRRIVRESAFVYMVKGIVSKEIYRSRLEDELKNIALERDNVSQDRFDRLIAAGEILDIEGPIEADELFRRAAAVLAPRLGTDEQTLLEQFRRREAESSTVVQPGLAIPHIVVQGRKLFDILPIRCRQGVRFPGHDEPVRAAFVLVGSRDERNYHLRALMAIAHIVGEPQFLERWHKAPSREHLRDLLLLSGRQREPQADST